jgi:hypothetical protein
MLRRIGCGDGHGGGEAVPTPVGERHTKVASPENTVKANATRGHDARRAITMPTIVIARDTM